MAHASVKSDIIPRRRPLPARLSLGGLGLGLATLVAGTWLSGIPYVLVRLGLPSPIRLALVDGFHVYVGMASVAFFAAKVSRVGFHERVEGVTGLVAWHRWMSWSLAILYTGVYGTGVVLLLPWPVAVSRALVNAHLLTAVWSVPPSVWHVWHYRPRTVPYLPRPGRPLSRRFWAGLGVFLVPLVAVLAVPRALSPLTLSGAGGYWTPAGLPGVFLDRLAVLGDGQTLLAGGEGLYVKHPAQPWHRLPVPNDLVLGLASAPNGAVYVGVTGGLDFASQADGPYRALAFPAREVHGIAINPADPKILWASSRSGFWRSIDSGGHWAAESDGMASPTTAWALAYLGSTLFGSDALHVYRWAGSGWAPVSGQRSVASLDPSPDGRQLVAASMGEGIQIFNGQGWQKADAGLSAHAGFARAIHITSVTSADRGLAFAATMFNGVAISHDGGSTWSELRAGIGSNVWRVIDMNGTLEAATERGMYEYQLPAISRPSVAWWIAVLAALVGLALISIPLAALPPGKS